MLAYHSVWWCGASMKSVVSSPLLGPVHGKKAFRDMCDTVLYLSSTLAGLLGWGHTECSLLSIRTAASSETN